MQTKGISARHNPRESECRNFATYRNVKAKFDESQHRILTTVTIDETSVESHCTAFCEVTSPAIKGIRNFIACAENYSCLDYVDSMYMAA
jgi:hypothetical protein